MTLSIVGLIDTQHNDNQHNSIKCPIHDNKRHCSGRRVFYYAGCRYTECRYAECRGAHVMIYFEGETLKEKQKNKFINKFFYPSEPT